jgi:hypothetical protein
VRSGLLIRILGFGCGEEALATGFEGVELVGGLLGLLGVLLEFIEHFLKTGSGASSNSSWAVTMVSNLVLASRSLAVNSAARVCRKGGKSVTSGVKAANSV